MKVKHELYISFLIRTHHIHDGDQAQLRRAIFEFYILF